MAGIASMIVIDEIFIVKPIVSSLLNMICFIGVFNSIYNIYVFNDVRSYLTKIFSINVDRVDINHIPSGLLLSQKSVKISHRASAHESLNVQAWINEYSKMHRLQKNLFRGLSDQCLQETVYSAPLWIYFKEKYVTLHDGMNRVIHSIKR